MITQTPCSESKCRDCRRTYIQCEAYEPLYNDDDDIVGWVCENCIDARLNN